MSIGLALLKLLIQKLPSRSPFHLQSDCIMALANFDVIEVVNLASPLPTDSYEQCYEPTPYLEGSGRYPSGNYHGLGYSWTSNTDF